MNAEDYATNDTAQVKELTERQKFVAALRDCAAFFEAHSDVAIPVSLQTFYLFPEVKEIATYAKAFGKCRKDGNDTFFNLTKTFGSAIEVQAAWYRNTVCERVVVGKKKVEVPVMQEVGKNIVEQDVVEWKCPKVLQPLAPPEVMAEIEESNDVF
jgi:hypothetical protein